MKFIVNYTHPSVFYTSRHYGRMADRKRGIKIFNTEAAAKAFVAEAAANNASNITIRIHN